jgi:tyrosyl-tRNA synthetase
MDTDIQVGATDQTFNMQAGRHLQKLLRNKESFVMSFDFLMGTDGRKMSKSWGNAIWLEDQPNDMYGKIMSLNDDLIPQYFLLGTNLPISDIPNTGHPMDLKKKLAFTIVSELHSSQSATSAQHYFESVFQQKETPTNIPEITPLSPNIIDILVQSQLAKSRSDARRLIDQGAVKVDNIPVFDIQYSVNTSSVISVGPRKFVKITG